jgi:hypothetical protein
MMLPRSAGGRRRSGVAALARRLLAPRPATSAKPIVSARRAVAAEAICGRLHHRWIQDRWPGRSDLDPWTTDRP